MSPSPFGCGLGPWRYSLSRPQRVYFCYGPVTRGLPWGDLVDRLQSFSFHHLCYPNYGALTSTPAGLSPAETPAFTGHTTQREALASLGSYQADPPIPCEPPVHEELGVRSHELLKETSRPNFVLLEAVTNGVKLVKNHRFEIIEAAG